VKAVWFNQLDFSALCRTSRLELAAAFSRMGHDLKIIGRYRGQRPRFAPLTPRPLLLKQHLPDPAGGIFFQLQVLLLALCEVAKKVDVVMVDHFCVPAMLPLNILSLAGLTRTKFVLDVRSAPVDMVGSRWRYNLSVRWAKLFYSGVTVITDLYREDISRRFRINRKKIGVWNSGVRGDIFDPGRVDRAHADKIRCRLGLGDSLVVIYHGVLSPYRGLQEVVRALALLNARGRRRAVLVLLGDGPAATEIASLAEAQGVTDAVKLIGSVPYEEVPDYLSVADAGVLPFPDVEWWKMSSPLKLLEYLAMEKPVILTDIAAHRAVLGEAACAFYISDNSPATIARAIRKVAESKGALPEIGKEARSIALKSFTWERQADNLLSYIARLCLGKGR
jgi:glycosyltransferase involved in cell wall biosynthesis